MKLSIATEEKLVYEGEVTRVTAPTRKGVITILDKHMPIVTLLVPGALITIDATGEIVYAVSGGVLSVHLDDKKATHIVVLADRIEQVETIDIDRAQAAYQRAELLVSEKEVVADIEFARFEAFLDKELNRIRVAKKYRNN